LATAVLWTALASTGGITPAEGQVAKLNPDYLTEYYSVGLNAFAITADSAQVVFRIVECTDPGDDYLEIDPTYRTRLFKAPITGGSFTELADSVVWNFWISPDSNWLLYESQNFGKVDLKSVPMAGGDPVMLGSSIWPVSHVTWKVKISANSTRAVYFSEQETAGTSDLFSVPLAGGTPTKLNNPLPPGEFIGTFEIAPDNSRVVYHVQHEWGLYSVPLGGGTPVKISVGPMAGQTGLSFQIAPDSSRVLFYGNEAVGVYSEYSVPIAGGASVRLNDLAVTEAKGLGRISPDSARVVFAGPIDSTYGADLNLYSVPIEGGAMVKLTPSPLGSFQGWAFSPDSSRFVYLAAQDTPGLDELYSVPAAGGTAVKLNAPVTNDIENYWITATSEFVLYRNDDDDSLRRVALDGNDAVKLNQSPANQFTSPVLAITADGHQVIYRANDEIYQTPVWGDTPAKLNDTPQAGGSIGGFAVSPDGAYVVYKADHDGDGFNELYSVPVAHFTSAAPSHWAALE
jgi:hypothetical protein